MRITIIPALPEHISCLADNLRQADIDECLAGGIDPRSGLVDSLRRSVIAWTALEDGEPIAMLGVCPINLLGGYGSPWMLGTDAVRRHALAFCKANRKIINQMLDLFPNLINFVDARNTDAIAWLLWYGFHLSGPQPYGPYNMPFYKFTLGRN